MQPGEPTLTPEAAAFPVARVFVDLLQTMVRDFPNSESRACMVLQRDEWPAFCQSVLRGLHVQQPTALLSSRVEMIKAGLVECDAQFCCGAEEIRFDVPLLTMCLALLAGLAGSHRRECEREVWTTAGRNVPTLLDVHAPHPAEYQRLQPYLLDLQRGIQKHLGVDCCCRICVRVDAVTKLEHRIAQFGGSSDQLDLLVTAHRFAASLLAKEIQRVHSRLCPHRAHSRPLSASQRN